MKRIWIAAVGLLLVMTCQSRTSMAVGENLIQNGSFDTDLTGWETEVRRATLGWSPDDADGASDSGSVQIEAEVRSLARLRSACVPVVGGRDYVFGATRKQSSHAGPGGNTYLTPVGATLFWSQGVACDQDDSTVSIRWSTGGHWSTTSKIVSAPLYATSAKLTLGASVGSVPLLETGEFAEQDALLTVNFDNIFFAAACGGTCGDPVPDADEHAAGDAAAALVTSSDALYILKGAVGEESCPRCICDVDDTGNVSATDALLTLAASIGGPVTLTCPL